MFFFLSLSTLILTSCGLLGGKKKDQGLPGFIVFSAQDSLGHNELFRMKPDGSHIRQLTHMGSDGAWSPAISPDGKTIVFPTAKNYTTLGLSLYLINADGTNLRPLGKQFDPLSGDSLVVYGSEAAWSPDGQKVAYDVCFQCELGGLNQEIFVYDRKAKTVTRLTNNPAEDSEPAWSPDGSQIAFVSNRDYYQADTLRFRTDLYVMDADGQNAHRLTQDGYVGRPSWFSSNKILYWSNDQISIEDIDSKNNVKVYSSTVDEGIRPLSVSNDGNYLLLLSFPKKGYTQLFSLQILNISDKSVKELLTRENLTSAVWYSKIN